VSGYYAAGSRPPSARSVADAVLCAQIADVHAASYDVYGVRKMHIALGRGGVTIGRDLAPYNRLAITCRQSHVSYSPLSHGGKKAM
jgi:hypothetical protein